jgi:hypothetical protein
MALRPDVAKAVGDLAERGRRRLRFENFLKVRIQFGHVVVVKIARRLGEIELWDPVNKIIWKVAYMIIFS